MRSSFGAQAGLEFVVIFLLQIPKCWICRHELPHSSWDRLWKTALCVMGHLIMVNLPRRDCEVLSPWMLCWNNIHSQTLRYLSPRLNSTSLQVSSPQVLLLYFPFTQLKEKKKKRSSCLGKFFFAIFWDALRQFFVFFLNEVKTKPVIWKFEGVGPSSFILTLWT